MDFKWLRNGLFFDKDGGAGGGGNPDDSAEDTTDEEKSDESKAGEDAKTKEKTYTKTELEAIVKKRLEREKEHSEAAAAKAKKEAEDAALAKNQEWEKLASQRQTTIDELQKEVDTLKAVKEQADSYRTVFEAQLTDMKKTLPKFVLPLIEKMDPLEAMQYIRDNAEDLGVKPETYSPTPKEKQKKVKDEDTTAAQQASASIVTRGF